MIACATEHRAKVLSSCQPQAVPVTPEDLIAEGDKVTILFYLSITTLTY